MLLLNKNGGSPALSGPILTIIFFLEDFTNLDTTSLTLVGLDDPQFKIRLRLTLNKVELKLIFAIS